MHTIEPYYNWRHLYRAEDDPESPFFGREYSEFQFTDTIYDHYIHPQWDGFGSPTLFTKLLYSDTTQGSAIIECMGEWNDAIHNDIMMFKREVIEPLMSMGIDRFIIIGENVLNFHYSDDCYYEEWFEECLDGWITFLNFPEHVFREFSEVGIDQYFIGGGSLEALEWRTFSPQTLVERVDDLVMRRLGA